MRAVVKQWLHRCPHLASCSATRQIRPFCSNRPLRRYGQPTPETHPWLLQEGQVTPGISKSEYDLRRHILSSKLGGRGSAATLFASPVKYMAGNIFHEYHQDPNFNYLTGFLEADSALLIECDNSRQGFKSTLFVKPKNHAEELWEGPRTGCEAAVKLFGVDEAYPIDYLDRRLEEIGRDYDSVYVGDVPDKYRDSIPQSKLKKIAPILHEMRLKKSAAEIACMRNAGQTSGRAYNYVMQRVHTTEKQLQHEIEYQIRKGGCDKMAYVPVVAGGKNGLMIHYTINDDILAPDQSLLVDAGGMFNGYVADITRTWPNNRDFNQAYLSLYQAVLNVQRACIEMCTETSSNSLQSIHAHSVRSLSQELRNVGINASESILTQSLYPHYVGHHLGMELHDSSQASTFSRLREGHTITIEPGLYIPDTHEWPSWARGTAIRIEDSIAVGRDSPTNLTVEAVKDPTDIQHLK